VRDRREEILVQLEAIIALVPDVVKTARNIDDVSGGAASRPAIILHDGTEEPHIESKRPRGNTKELMVLRPQIYILWGDKSKLVATKVNEIRRELINRIWLNVDLRKLLGSQQDSDLHYVGCALDTFTGESREAKMLINFEFVYVLDATELV
jgi:hypothetical protein